MNKRAIAILGALFILIVGTLGFLVFQKYSSKSSATQTITQNTPTTSSTPISQTPATTSPSTTNNTIATTTSASQDQGTVVKISDTQVVSPALFYNGNGVSFFTLSGDLYQADFAYSGLQLQLTREKNLGIQNKPAIGKILWPLAGNDFIAQNNNASLPSWSYFNSQTGTYIDLPHQVSSLDWMPSGDKIMYIWLDNGKATLNISDPDTSNYHQIANMWELDDRISVSPDGTIVLYYETNTASTTNPIYAVTSDGKIWKTPVSTGYNYGVLWSPDSQKFLYGKRDPASGNYQLWYYNLITGDFKNLGLTTTPDKALWSNDSSTVYAAVPLVGSISNGLTQDEFVRIDTATLTEKEYKNFDQQVDGQDLFLSQDRTKLFFKNAQDGYLYYLDITDTSQ